MVDELTVRSYSIYRFGHTLVCNFKNWHTNAWFQWDALKSSVVHVNRKALFIKRFHISNIYIAIYTHICKSTV